MEGSHALTESLPSSTSRIVHVVSSHSNKIQAGSREMPWKAVLSCHVYELLGHKL